MFAYVQVLQDETNVLNFNLYIRLFLFFEIICKLIELCFIVWTQFNCAKSCLSFELLTYLL